VSVAECSTDPVSTPVPSAGTCFDVHLSANNTLTSATVTRCDAGSGKHDGVLVERLG